jgi:hypothetical protein
LRAKNEQILGVGISPFTPRIGLGATLKPKSRLMRFYIGYFFNGRRICDPPL